MAKVEELRVSPVDIRTLRLPIVGTSPLVIQRFNFEGFRDGMTEDGINAKRNKTKSDRGARDFDAEVEACKHISTEGWEGFNAMGLKRAMVSSCKMINIMMSRAKLAVFVIADGFSKYDGIPLVRINGTAERVDHAVVNANGSPDVRSRPMYRKWDAMVTLHYDANQFTATDVANMLNRAGAQIGIGSGRADSKNGVGMGWGGFRILGSDEQLAA